MGKCRIANVLKIGLMKTSVHVSHITCPCLFDEIYKDFLKMTCLILLTAQMEILPPDIF